jgi:hypothetical protein
MIHHHFPNSNETIRGSLKGQRQGICSTKQKALDELIEMAATSLQKSSIHGKEYLDYLWESNVLLQYIQVVFAFCVSLTVDGLSINGNQGIYTPLRQHLQCGEII